MVQRRIPKTKVQAYFTHPDRPLNFGRITNIGDGRYGRDVPAASQADVDRFIAEWNDKRGLAVEKIVANAFDFEALPPSDSRRVRSLFTKSPAGHWLLTAGETDGIECKRSYALGGRLLRAIAALANNRGGYIFLCVAEEDYAVVGLANDRFQSTDASRISQVLRGSMEPVPRIETSTCDFEGRVLGVLFVHPESDGPVIATKTDQELREGTVYFRYHGETRPIGAAEFRKILAERDRRLRDANRVEISRLLDLGPRGAVVDLASNSQAAARIVREGIDEADVLRNFVRQETVEFPLAYLLRSCTTARSWLPIFYYLQMTGVPLVEAISIIENKETTYLARKRDLLARLRGTRTAFAPPQGRVIARQRALLDGKYSSPKTARDAGDTALAIVGLPNAGCELPALLQLLREAIETIRSDKKAKVDIWSYVYKAAARLDELYFRPRQ